MLNFFRKKRKDRKDKVISKLREELMREKMEKSLISVQLERKKLLARKSQRRYAAKKKFLREGGGNVVENFDGWPLYEINVEMPSSKNLKSKNENKKKSINRISA